MRFHPWFRSATLAALALTSPGCITLDDGSQRATQERENVLRLEEKINRMNGRIEAIELEHRQFQIQLDQIRRTSAAADQHSVLKTRVDDLDRRIQALDAAREVDKQQIAETITKKLMPYLAPPTPAPANRPTTRQAAGPGGQHEVQAGETLSKIAAAYGLTVRELMEANGLSNADMLRQGQKLTIPKR